MKICVTCSRNFDIQHTMNAAEATQHKDLWPEHKIIDARDYRDKGVRK
jgi:hypothetical protein